MRRLAMSLFLWLGSSSGPGCYPLLERRSLRVVRRTGSCGISPNRSTGRLTAIHAARALQFCFQTFGRILSCVDRIGVVVEGT